MLIGYRRGQGSIILRVKILNSSVSTGAGLTGLTNTSSGLIISTIADTESSATAYTAAASNIETITTNGTYSAPSSGKCRFKEVDSTNHKGIYEIQIADARFNVSSAKSLLVSIAGATNAAETDVVIPLRDLDPFDAVRAGLTAFPNVASGSAGALITSGTGTAQLSVSSGLVTLAGVTHTNAVIPTVTAVTNGVTVTTNNDKTGYSIGTAGITSSSFAAGAIDAAAMNVTGSEFTAIPWNAAWDTEVQSEVQDAIEANHLDHLLAVAYDPASPVGVADSLFNDLVEDNGAGTTRFTTTALEQAPAGGGGGGTDWTTDERTQIRSILGVATSGTTPTNPTVGILDTIRDSVLAVEVDTQDIQGRLPAALVSGRMDASVGAMASSVLTASALATDAATEIATAVRTDLTVELGRIDASISSRMATFTLPTHFSSLEIAANGHVSAVVKSLDNNAITASSIQGGAITAAKFAAGAIDANALAADAATEIATAVNTGQMTESYRAAGVAPSPAQALFELLAHMGDSSISGTTKTLKKLDGTTAKTFTLDSSTAPTSITEAT